MTYEKQNHISYICLYQNNEIPDVLTKVALYFYCYVQVSHWISINVYYFCCFDDLRHLHAIQKLSREQFNWMKSNKSHGLNQCWKKICLKRHIIIIVNNKAHRSPNPWPRVVNEHICFCFVFLSSQRINENQRKEGYNNKQATQLQIQFGTNRSVTLRANGSRCIVHSNWSLWQGITCISTCWFMYKSGKV